MWKIMIEQFFQIQDYALWEVIENGNSFKPITRTTTNEDGTSTSSSNSSLQNVAFVSTPSSTNDVNTASVQVSTVSTPVSTASSNFANLSDATVYAFLANQPDGSQIVHEDLEQIHEDNLEEMDLKWQLALLSIRARKYYQRTGKKITINGSDVAGYDKSKVECFNYHKIGHFARESRDTSPTAMIAIDGVGFDWSFMADEGVPTNMALMTFSDSEVLNDRTCSNSCLKNYETLKNQYDNLRIKFNKSEFDLANYKRGLASVEEQLVFYKKNEVVFYDQVVVLKRDASFKDSETNALKIQIENLKKEKESNLFKINSYENASKSLDAPIIEEWVFDSDEDESKFREIENDGTKLVLNNVKKGTGQREVRPVWNNALRTNHQNFSNSRRNFAPTVVLTKSGLVPISIARQSSSRAAVPVSTARPINSTGPKTFVNVAKFRPNVPQKSHSPPKRPFYQQTVLKNRILNNKVNTAKINFVNTAKGKSVSSTVRKQRVNAVKSSACWVWRPKVNVVDHGDPHVTLKDIGIFNNGCSRHMTGNKSYLTDYQDHDGGFVAFTSSSKGELKFNLFSVSQMCDMKNSVLFTKTECLILSPNFKLPDENQVMLKIPRKDNMYSFDLKNIVPSKGIENQLNHKVKIIRCDNGTKFKNYEMNQFCGIKGIKREFSNASTPQQNRVAERKNRTLIEASRTMLADSLLPIPFWAKAVNIVCYVQNRVLVTKPHNKTPYELLIGRTPIISFMRPFGCLVTILNTLDHLGKFDGKADEGFLVGYSINSKAFRVFNSRTRKVEENLHVNFLENKPNVAGSLETNSDAGQARKEKTPNQEYILLPLLHTSSYVSSSFEEDESSPNDDTRKKNKVKDPTNAMKGLGEVTHTNSTNRLNTVSSSFSTEDHERPKEQRNEYESLFEQDKEDNNSYRVFTPINAAAPSNADDPIDPLIHFGNDYDDEDVGAEANMNNLETAIGVSPIPTTRIDKDHPKAQIIGEVDSAIEPKKVTQALDEESWIDVKSAFLYGTIEEEVYVSQPPGFVDPAFPDKVYKVEKALYGLHQAPKAWYETLSTYLINNGFRRGTIDKTLFIKKIKNDILLVQVYVDDIIFGSTKKSLSTKFEQLMHKRFQMSSMGELTFFLGMQVEQRADVIFLCQDKYVYDILKKFGYSSVKTASTLMETYKPLTKDENGTDVDVYLYRSMIGSLIYLTSSRPDIMFVVCACSRFQVQPKASYMHAVKRIFRYLKGQPILGLLYPKDSPLELIAYSESNYVGASLDRKSITGGCQFLGCRLVSWQCKKQTIVANSTTEAEYIDASNYYAQVLWLQNQLLDYGYTFMKTKIHVDNESAIYVVKNLVSHSKTKHIEISGLYIVNAWIKVQELSNASLVNTARLILGTARLDMEFVDQHNMVACLEKTDANADFHQIVDFLSSSYVHHSLTVSPVIYASYIEQFWNTASSKTVNDEKQIHATVNSKAIVVTKGSIRNSLLFNDADGTPCLTNEVIFQNLALMGYEGDFNKLTFQKALFSP
ncbi:putative ribonuclease H-like domain-containing protein [Tanacetum coccineum]